MQVESKFIWPCFALNYVAAILWQRQPRTKLGLLYLFPLNVLFGPYNYSIFWLNITWSVLISASANLATLNANASCTYEYNLFIVNSFENLDELKQQQYPCGTNLPWTTLVL